MAFLGNFREGIEKIRFHLKADRPLIPASVYMTVVHIGLPPEPLVIVPDTDSDPIPDNEFKNSPDLNITSKPLGIAALQFGAADTHARSTQVVDTFRVTSSYGRNYGEDYGNGL